MIWANAAKNTVVALGAAMLAVLLVVAAKVIWESKSVDVPPVNLLTISSAKFSPTADTIVFTYDSLNYKGIFLMDREGKVIRRLRESSSQEWSAQPSFSPDGGKIAFVSGQARKPSNIYLLDMDKNTVTQLTSTKDANRKPIFSPDGNKIYFLRHRASGGWPGREDAPAHQSDIFYVDLTGGREHPVTDNRFFRLDNYAVLPNGRIIIQTIDYSYLRHELWEIDISNPSSKKPICPYLHFFSDDPNYYIALDKYGLVKIEHFVTSRGGRYVAFQWANQKSDYKHRNKLYLMDMNTTETRQITFPRMTNPIPYDISADNSKILYATGKTVHDIGYETTHPSDLWIASLDGSDPRNIALDFSRVALEGPVNTSQPWVHGPTPSDQTPPKP